MTMRDAIHIPEDDLIQYATGTLSDVQLNSITAHISLCGVCRAELAQIQVALASYSTTLPEEVPPAGAKERFMAHLDSKPAPRFVQQTEEESGFFFRGLSIREWFLTPLPYQILSGALAAALLFFVYDDAMHYHEIRQLTPAMLRFEAEASKFTELEDFLNGSNVQEISLHQKPDLVKAPEGRALYSPASGKLLFTASNMPAPPVGKAYELWVLPVGGGAPIAAGVFKPNLQGNASLIFPTLTTTVQASGFGVTVEDEAGSTVPTSPIILSGQ